MSAYQPIRLPPFAALRAFESAARLGSFRKAAEEMHVTPSAISQQVKQLEQYLGVQLFRRAPKALEITREGEAMLPRVRDGFASFGAAMAEAVRHRSAGPVAISAPPNFARRWLVPRLPRFAQAHPEVEVHLTSSAAMIDGRQDELPALPYRVDEESVALIRYGDGQYANTQVDRIFRASYVPVCSPSLMQGPNALLTPYDLRHHTLIHDDTVPEERGRPSWHQWLKLEGIDGIDADRGPHFNDGALAIEAASDGLGVTLALKPLVAADVRAGRLAIPFEAPVPSGFAYYLVTATGRELSRSMTVFRDWLLKEAKSEAL